MIRLALRSPAEHAELVLAELLELVPGGVEETNAGDVVEYAVYGAPGELPELPALRAAVRGVPIEVHTSEVADDWAERWKQFHRPVLVSPPVPPAAPAPPAAPVPPLHVRPPWLPPSGVRDAQEIVIDPGQAFGTGAHATTHLCLELLLAVAAEDTDPRTGVRIPVRSGCVERRPDMRGLVEPEWAERRLDTRGPALDVGAGSGVLAIAAAKLGYAPVLALDYDPQSIAAVHSNAAANRVKIEARRFDLRNERLPAGHPLVLANLLRPLLLRLADSMAGMVHAPRHLIASGLLREEAGEVAAAFAERVGLRERQRRERGEWAALWLEG